ncbi:MAG: hypothetical protein JWN84_3570 [Nocardioides sp.]|nr:hypothetical protein [Nocardioides sp.]
MAEATHRDTRLLVVCLVAVWVLWGSVYLAIRLVIDEVAPFQAMAVRFLLAGLVLGVVAVARRGWRVLRLTRPQVGVVVVTGVLLLGLGNGLQALAQHEGLPSGVAALVVAAVPVWAVLLRAATGDRPAGLTVAGVVVGFGGLVLLVVLGSGTGDRLPLIGVLLCLVASLTWTLGSYLQGVLAMPRDLVAVAAYQQVVAGCCSALLALSRGESLDLTLSTRGWAAMAFLVLGCSVCGYLAYVWLLGNVSLSVTATHAYVNPVVAVALGWAVLGEPVDAAIVLGGGVVVVAVVLVVGGERRPARTQVEALRRPMV